LNLRKLILKYQYRSDKHDLISEFFLPCLSNSIIYERCIEYVTIKSLITLSFGFQNFNDKNAMIKIITGNKFRSSDLNILSKLFYHQKINSNDKDIVKNDKLNMLQYIINNKKFKLKIAIPRSEKLDGVFAEKMGIFKDVHNNIVAFIGTSNEAFDYQSRNFESIDVFTSWADKSRINIKTKDFDELWNNKIKYVRVYDFLEAEKKSLLKYAVDWATNTS